MLRVTTLLKYPRMERQQQAAPPALGVGRLALYQEKVAEDVGGKDLLQPVGCDPVLLGQQSLSCGEHVNHISETAEEIM